LSLVQRTITALAINKIEAAKEAGAIYSGAFDHTGTDTIFRQTVHAIETGQIVGIPTLSVDYLFSWTTILRTLPQSPSKTATFCDPRNPGNRFASVAVEDVRKVCSCVYSIPKNTITKRPASSANLIPLERLKGSCTIKILHEPIKIQNRHVSFL
jgi:hypothetical protein